jgi:hypothetical protein
MKPILTVAFIFCTLVGAYQTSYSQQRYQRWGGGSDDQTLNFGFSFHYISADYKIALEPDWQNAGYNSITSPFSRDLGLGLLASLKLGENTNLLFTPNLTFLNVDMEFEKDTETEVRTIHRSNIELPLLLKFKSDRKTNMRGYLIGGGQYAINVAPSKRYKPDEDIMTKPGYFAYTAGIGFDIYFDFFKMSPEIKWVQSVGNLLDRTEPNVFNGPIQRLMLRSLQVSLIFE